MTPVQRAVLLRPWETILFDDFSTYADSAALQAVWTGGGTTPLLTLSSGAMRVENGAASSAYAFRTITTVPGQVYRFTGNCIAKGANTPRAFAGTGANSGNLATAILTTTGAFSLTFTATSVNTWIHAGTVSSTIGHFVVVDDYWVQRIS